MTYFLHQPNGIFLRSDEQLLGVGRELDPGTYIVNQTPQGEYFLEKGESFTRPKKLYGNVQAKADRIMTTFKSRDVSTGVLLSGEQWSGKTMLLRELSIICAEQGISTIIVAQPFHGPDFNKFIQSINFPCVVAFDEFEKLYDEDGQEDLLTLLDGVFPTKKLFILTANNVWRVDQHMLNRPGRIFYHLKYEGLEKAFIMEYAQDNLKNKNFLQGIEDVSAYFRAFNFDMLKALVEEMNRFNINALEATEMLNMSPVERDSAGDDFDVTLTLNGKKKKVYCERYRENPLAQDIEISYEPNKDKHGCATDIKFSVEDLTKVDGKSFFYERDGFVLTLTRRVSKGFAF